MSKNVGSGGRYNDPAPAFPLEMPWPVVFLYVVLGAVGLLMGEPDPGKAKKKK